MAFIPILCGDLSRLWRAISVHDTLTQRCSNVCGVGSSFSHRSVMRTSFILFFVLHYIPWWVVLAGMFVSLLVFVSQARHITLVFLSLLPLDPQKTNICRSLVSGAVDLFRSGSLTSTCLAEVLWSFNAVLYLPK